MALARRYEARDRAPLRVCVVVAALLLGLVFIVLGLFLAFTDAGHDPVVTEIGLPPIGLSSLKGIHARYNMSLEWLHRNRQRLISKTYNTCQKALSSNRTECKRPTDRPIPKTHLILALDSRDSSFGSLAAKNEEPTLFHQHFFDISKADFYAMHKYEGGTIVGHLPYGTHLLLNGTASYVAVLREPIDLVLALYDTYVATFPSPSAAAPLPDWCWAHKPVCQNPAVQIISGMLNAVPEAGTLKIAKWNLRRFGFVGIAERWKDTCAMLSYFLGWNQETLSCSEHSAEGTKAARAGISAEWRDLLHKENALDIQLYQEALRIFEEERAEVAHDAGAPPETPLASARDPTEVVSFLTKAPPKRIRGTGHLRK